MSYWFWSPSHGWLYMSELVNPRVYVLDLDGFRMRTELF